jgi:hypothetical protein
MKNDQTRETRVTFFTLAHHCELIPSTAILLLSSPHPLVSGSVKNEA